MREKVKNNSIIYPLFWFGFMNPGIAATANECPSNCSKLYLEGRKVPIPMILFSREKEHGFKYDGK